MNQLDYAQLSTQLRQRGYDEDAIQDTMIKLLSRDRHISNPLAYAARLTYRRHIRRLVKESKRALVQVDIMIAAPAPQLRRLIAREVVEDMPAYVVLHGAGARMSGRKVGQWRKAQ